jgi:hypothetical protein
MDSPETQRWNKNRTQRQANGRLGYSVAALAIDIDQAPLWLACKDTPLQKGDDTSITERGGMITSTLLWIEVWTDPLQKSIN